MSLAEELVARLPMTEAVLASVTSAAPLGVAANPLIRLAPNTTEHLFEALCAQIERAPRAARLDAFLRLDAVTEQRRARLVAEGRAAGPVGSLTDDVVDHQRIRSTTNPLDIPARYASTLAVVAPELFAGVVSFARAVVSDDAWETLAALTADGCDLPIGDVIVLSTKL